MPFLQSQLRQQIQAIESDSTLDASEKMKRKQNLLLLHNLSIGGGPLSPNGILSSLSSSAMASLPTTMSPNAPSFYPPGDTVESVVGRLIFLGEDMYVCVHVCILVCVFQNTPKLVAYNFGSISLKSINLEPN